MAQLRQSSFWSGFSNMKGEQAGFTAGINSGHHHHHSGTALWAFLSSWTKLTTSGAPRTSTPEFMAGGRRNRSAASHAETHSSQIAFLSSYQKNQTVILRPGRENIVTSYFFWLWSSSSKDENAALGLPKNNCYLGQISDRKVKQTQLPFKTTPQL